MRGNPSPRPLAFSGRRSIPACAGEPQQDAALPHASRVYPRVCGGTISRSQGGLSARGLSPRVRGNPIKGWVDRQHERSIPACAGEPVYALLLPSALQVYPRVCGGTQFFAVVGHWSIGLSPRVRGNPLSDDFRRHTERSIPACAGEPLNPAKSAL